MTQRTITILRATSGSGKTTFANIIAYPCCVCSADDYFTDKDGNYNFDVTKLGAAHGACRAKFDEALKDPIITNIVIANTNTKESEWKYYADQAEKAGLLVFFVVLEKRHNNINVHGVGEDILLRQERTIRSNLKLL